MTIENVVGVVLIFGGITITLCGMGMIFVAFQIFLGK